MNSLVKNDNMRNPTDQISNKTPNRFVIIQVPKHKKDISTNISPTSSLYAVYALNMFIRNFRKALQALHNYIFHNFSIS